MQEGAVPIFGPTSQVLGIVNMVYGLYKAKQQAEFNLVLVNQLTEIQKEISLAIKELDLILAKINSIDVWGTGDQNPLRFIDILETEWNSNQNAVNDTSYITLNEKMTYLHLIICGADIDGGKINAAQIYLDVLTNIHGNRYYPASNLEKLYSYFLNIILARMMTGFRLLGDYEIRNLTNSGFYESWHRNFTVGIPAKEGHEAEEPYLANEGKQFQKTIDKVIDKISWTNAGETDASDTVDDFFGMGRILMDGSLNVPPGEAILGIRLYEASDNVMGIEAWSGKINEFGYVISGEKGESINRLYNQGNGTINALEEHNHDVVVRGNNEELLSCLSKVYVGKIVTPDNNSVITDVCWHEANGKETRDLPVTGTYEIDVRYFHLSVKFANYSLVKNGNEYDFVIGDSGDWSGCPSLDSKDWQEFDINTDSGYINIVQWNPGGTEGQGWPKLWNTPMTGLRYNHNSGNFGGTVSFRTDIHGTSFGQTNAPEYNPPSATTNSASEIENKSATLNGLVNDNNTTTTACFYYSTDPKLEKDVQNILSNPYTIMAGTGNTAVSASITGLAPNTTYYFSMKGLNSAGIATGDILCFKTSN